MPIFSGKSGVVTNAVTGSPVTNVTDWTLNIQHRVTDHLIMGGLVNPVRRIGHVVDFTGSYTALPELPADTVELETMTVGSTGTAAFTESSVAGNAIWTGTIFVTDITTSVSSDGTVSSAVTFEGQNGLTRTTTI